MSFVIAKSWKFQEVPFIDDCVFKLQDIWLSSKLSAICKYRAGNMGALRRSNSQWAILIDSGYVTRAKNIKESLLSEI